jgi:DNA-binding MarR family transcriptional regulator
MSTGRIPPPFDDAAPEEARTVVRAFLSEDEERAWLSLLEAHSALVNALEVRLRAEHNVVLGAVEALIEIAHTDEGSLGVSDLAERIGLSQSRTSRLAIDLEREGLVERQRDAADSRSTRVAVTKAGRDLLLKAAPAYFATIREHLFEGLSEGDVKQLARILGRTRRARGSLG